MNDLLIPTKSTLGSQPAQIRSVAKLRELVSQWRQHDERIGLVPTMGALHEGHVSLVKLAREHANRVVVSIFVNPAQFAPNEDFETYPRSLKADLEKLAKAGADTIFTPDTTTIYPPGFATQVSVKGPAAAQLEDKARPNHFTGVATIVAKLHIIVQPDVAIYGEKDFQQLAVIRQMNRDLNLAVEIVGAPIVREADGLAMSSRNQYLSPEERAAAPALYHTMMECRERLLSGQSASDVLSWGRTRIADAGFVVAYLELRDADTLSPAGLGGSRPLRMLTAAQIGSTRLIDNIPIYAG